MAPKQTWLVHLGQMARHTGNGYTQFPSREPAAADDWGGASLPSVNFLRYTLPVRSRIRHGCASTVGDRLGMLSLMEIPQRCVLNGGAYRASRALRAAHLDHTLNGHEYKGTLDVSERSHRNQCAGRARRCEQEGPACRLLPFLGPALSPQWLLIPATSPRIFRQELNLATSCSG